jgi:two-component system sensor histidine kinase HydH
MDAAITCRKHGSPFRPDRFSVPLAYTKSTSPTILGIRLPGRFVNNLREPMEAIELLSSLISGADGRFEAPRASSARMLKSRRCVNVRKKSSIRVAALFATIFVISLLHYETPTSYLWLHTLLEQAYYIPLLLMALWYGWRGGILASIVTGILYIPHIQMAWHHHREYNASQWVELGMFFLITALTGVLADHERAQRLKAEQMAEQLEKANSELQSSSELLRRADRLSAMGELSAGLAHEIRNPLGSIEGAVQILRRDQLAPETKREFGELAQRELERLKGIVNQFLNFARPQPPSRIATAPVPLLSSVAKLVGETAKMSNVDVCVIGTPGLPVISVDPEQIKQVLLNLVINAIQAMPTGGEINLQAVSDGQNMRLEVQDGGVGVAPDNAERIFNPFFTTREEGTGLGLSIAERIVSQHGGGIEMRRNHGRGMTFSVVLPLGAMDAPSHTVPEAKQ